MERNSVGSSGLEWENLAVYNGKPIEIPQQMGFAMSSLGSGHIDLHCNDFGSCSSSKYPVSAAQESSKEALDGFGKMGSMHHPYKNTHDDIIRIQNVGTIASSGGSGEPMIGLRLGSQKEYGDSFPLSSAKTSIPVSSMPTKRSRASYQNMQNPCCQVEGCNLDLKSAKDYHRRHRICESHSKSPKVIVAGKERRFCQQCSRFHDLSEFDDKKRSCRRRLSDHNARRRRVQPESIQLSSTALSSGLYDQRQQNVLLSGLPISLSNSTWENASTSMSRQALIRPSKHRGLDATLNFPSNEIHNSISNLPMDSERLSSIHGSNPRILDQCLHVPSTNSPIASDLLSAHSLLSSNAWSLNEGESTSMDGLVHGNYNQVLRHSDSESHHLSLFQSSNVPVEQGPPVPLVHAVNLHNGGSSHQQEYQLFKASYDSGGFYSSHRYL